MILGHIRMSMGIVDIHHVHEMLTNSQTGATRLIRDADPMLF